MMKCKDEIHCRAVYAHKDGQNIQLGAGFTAMCGGNSGERAEFPMEIPLYILFPHIFPAIQPSRCSFRHIQLLHLSTRTPLDMAFSTLSVLVLLQSPLRVLPTCISWILQAWVSSKRIDAFMITEDIQDYRTSGVGEKAGSVVFTDADFPYSEKVESVLKA